MVNSWVHEKKPYSLSFDNVAGVDEAGRGALAGPVVSAAVILPRCFGLFSGIDNFKKLSVTRRKRLYDLVRTSAVAVCWGRCDAHTIDRINVLNASLVSMAILCRIFFPGLIIC